MQVEQYVQMQRCTHDQPLAIEGDSQMKEYRRFKLTRAVGYLAFIGFAVVSLMVDDPATDADSSKDADKGGAVVVPFPKR